MIICKIKIKKLKFYIKYLKIQKKFQKKRNKKTLLNLDFIIYIKINLLVI